MSKRNTLQNPQEEIKQFNRRTVLVAILVLLLVLSLVWRLFYLQVVQHNLYSTLSRQNLLNVAPIDPNRGLIFDRNGVLLAENVPVFSLEIAPDHVPNMKQTIADLSQIVSLSPTDIQEFYKQFKAWHRFSSIPLKVQLNNDEVSRFAVNQYRFPGVSVQAHLIRYYPYGANMVQVLGYVGRINANEFAQVDQNNYSASNYIGKVGIEKYYETQLHGTVGIQQVETDAGGRVIRETKATPATPGNNIYLTIDSRLEFAAEKALNGQNGAIVAIDPRNGEVLALVSNPSYDPNPFVIGISNDAFQALQNDPDKPLYNRALRGTYAPGSTIKPYLALAGLETGVVTPSYHLFCPGWFKLPDSSHIYHDWRRSGHGVVDMENGIIESCDVYFYNLANRLGIDRLSNMLFQFGFGQKTQIDTDSELPGLVPTPAWKRQFHGQAWYPGDTLITGIGQGFLLVTPLQLASAISVMADRGIHYAPHLLLKSQAPNGAITITAAKQLPPVILPDADWDLVLKAIHEVITDPRGTGYRAGHNAPYAYAGKSGTAQVFSIKDYKTFKYKNVQFALRDHSWFSAYAPLDQPRIALAVIVEHGDEGEASMIARQVLDAYLLNDKKS